MSVRNKVLIFLGLIFVMALVYYLVLDPEFQRPGHDWNCGFEPGDRQPADPGPHR